MGKPRLFFGVTGGAVDSLVSKYTAFKRLRSDDPYTPGKSGSVFLRVNKAHTF
ncbi:MAG: hypothetical protein PVG39_27345 [Desulfobacteraceae bacterium]